MTSLGTTIPRKEQRRRLPPGHVNAVFVTDLVILGTSDIHGLIDYDYDLLAGEHRTVTLVLAREKSSEAIREALIAGHTTALYMGHVIGREPQVRTVVESSGT